MHELLSGERIEILSFDDFINEQRRRTTRKYSSVIAMYKGDMWDRGKGYIGPLPIKEDDSAGKIMMNIKRMFTSRNIIEEIVDRAVDGLLSKAPNWQVYSNKRIEDNPRLKNRTTILPSVTFDENGNRVKVPVAKVDKKIQEAELILAELWTSAKLGDRLRDSVTSMLLTEKGKLRIYFPTKKIRPVKNIIDAVKYVRVQFVDEKQSVVLDDGVDKLSVVQISAKDKKWEISFTDDNGKTYVAALSNKGTLNESEIDREINEDSDSEALSEAIQDLRQQGLIDLSDPMSLGSNITVDEIEGKALVTESMLQCNRALNLGLSLAVGILVESGYREMITTNVALKTKTITNADGTEEEVPIAIERGATTVTNLVGEQTMDPSTGEVKFEKPDVIIKEPSPLDAFVAAEELYYRQILSESKQLFVLTSTSAEISGESRIQGRQDFLKKILRYKPSVDIHGGWLLNTLLKVVATLAGKDGYFDDYSVLFDSLVSAGDLSADEKNVVISRYTAGLISRETALVLLGSEDPLIEIDKIKADQAEKLDEQVTRLEATAKFGNMADNGRPKELPDGSTKKSSELNGK